MSGYHPDWVGALTAAGEVEGAADPCNCMSRAFIRNWSQITANRGLTS